MKLIYNTVLNRIDAQIEESPIEYTKCNRHCDGNPRLDFRCKQPDTYCDYRVELEVPEGMEFFKVVDGVVVEDLEAKATNEAKLLADSESAKQAQITALYNQMNADVYAEMERIFGTANPDSAVAYHQTYILMKDKPQLFTESMQKTEQEIVEIAELKLAEIDPYAVFRMQRIAQFQQEKANILNN